MNRRNTGCRAGVVAAAGTGLALAASTLLAMPAGAVAGAYAPELSPTSGPVGTTIVTSGSCGVAAVGDWISVRFRLYYPDAFEAQGGPDYFAESTGELTSNGTYAGQIKVPASATYVTKGDGPAMPGPEVTKPVTGTIRVLAVCNSDLGGPTPLNDLSQSWAAFSVQSATKSLVSTARPTIDGKAKVGKKLKASKGSWSPKPTSYDYQWFRGKNAIKGKKAEKRKYEVTSADAGKKLRVKVTASRPGYSDASAKSKAVKIKK